MGQHKTNPTAILAKQGKLPPKKKPMSKKEVEALILAKMLQKVPLGWIENVVESK